MTAFDGSRRLCRVLYQNLVSMITAITSAKRVCVDCYEIEDIKFGKLQMIVFGKHIKYARAISVFGLSVRFHTS